MGLKYREQLSKHLKQRQRTDKEILFPEYYRFKISRNATDEQLDSVVRKQEEQAGE